jgi:hypothetical protein
VTVSQNSLAFRDLDTSEECFAKGKKKNPSIWIGLLFSLD